MEEYVHRSMLSWLYTCSLNFWANLQNSQSFILAKFYNCKVDDKNQVLVRRELVSC